MIRGGNVLASVLTCTLLIAFPGMATAQPKAGGRKAIDTTTPQPRDLRPMTTTGVVTHVDPIGRTFTVNANGKAVTFGAANLTTLPEVGATAEVTHQANPGGGMAQATTVKGSKSNSDNVAGGDTGQAGLRAKARPFGHNAPLVVTGRVTHVDPVAKTFTLTKNGKPVKVDATNIAALPKVGDSVEVTHSGLPGGVLFATTVKSSKSNSSE